MPASRPSRRAALTATAAAAPGPAVSLRRGKLLFVLNCGSDPKTVQVPGDQRDLSTGGIVMDEVSLGRYAVAVLKP